MSNGCLGNVSMHWPGDVVHGSMVKNVVYINSDDDTDPIIEEMASADSSDISFLDDASLVRSSERALQASAEPLHAGGAVLRKKNIRKTSSTQGSREHHQVIDIDEACIGANSENSFDLTANSSASPVRELLFEDLTKPPQHPGRCDAETLKCRICMDRLVEPAATECGHVFCLACLLAAVEQHPLCPLCRQYLGLRKIRRLYI